MQAENAPVTDAEKVIVLAERLMKLKTVPSTSCPFDPFHSIADAWLLVPALHRRGVLCVVRNLNDADRTADGIWYVATLTTREHQVHQADDNSASRAISEAAYQWAAQQGDPK